MFNIKTNFSNTFAILAFFGFLGAGFGSREGHNFPHGGLGGGQSRGCIVSRSRFRGVLAPELFRSNPTAFADNSRTWAMALVWTQSLPSDGVLLTESLTRENSSSSESSFYS